MKSRPAAPDHPAARAFRYLYRVPWLLLHLLLGLPLVLLALLLPWRSWRVAGAPLEQHAVRCWSSGLLRVFGMRVRRVGEPLHAGVLLVANHVSWVDIELVHSQYMVGFVAKAEIARWPLVGWLAACGHTIFHTRGSSQSLDGVVDVMVERLQQSRPVAVFPEGRTRGGEEVGPFHARIFTSAVQAAVPVQPVALRYGAGGNAQTVVAFAPGEHFFGNFIRLLGEPSRQAEVHFLEPIRPEQVQGRRQIAELARSRIVAVMEGP